jgi:histidine ammonia-lyase
MPAAKQNFHVSNNAKVFVGQSTMKASQAVEAESKDLAAEGQARIDLAKRLRQSSIPFNKQDKFFTTTNEENYPAN